MKIKNRDIFGDRPKFSLRIAYNFVLYWSGTAREGWNFILQRGGSPIFWGSKWPRSLSSSGRSTFEIASHDNETTCNQPARAPTPSANTGNLCKRLNAIIPAIEKHHEPRSSSTHFTPRPPFGSWFLRPFVLLCIIIVVDAKFKVDGGTWRCTAIQTIYLGKVSSRFYRVSPSLEFEASWFWEGNKWTLLRIEEVTRDVRRRVMTVDLDSKNDERFAYLRVTNRFAKNYSWIGGTRWETICDGFAIFFFLQFFPDF